MLKRYTIDTTIEDKILTGLIISDKFCREIVSAYDKKYMSTVHAGIIGDWCLDYYDIYKKAPGKNIQDIFEIEQSNIKPEDAELISAFLEKLSEQYEQENFNAQLFIDRAMPYFRKQALKQSIEKAYSYLELDQIEEAEKELENKKQIYRETANWVNPFDERVIDQFFKDEEDRTNFMFKMPGAVGNIIGEFERGTLYGVFAPVKRGKTWWLQEIAVQSVLNKYRTIFVSLEMSSQKTKRRLYRRLTALGEESKDYIYPCFDCKKNQDNSCTKMNRTNRVRLLDANFKKPNFSREINYRVCTVCRGTPDFSVGTWFTTYFRSKMSISSAKKRLLASKDFIRDSYRFFAYPMRSANLSKVRRDIDRLEYTEDFTPDVIVLDYADILAPENKTSIGRDRFDETWQTLKQIASERNILMVTASQTNRGSFEKKNVGQADAAEDIRKLAHVDAAGAINQMPSEKRESVIRYAAIAERDDEFDMYRSALVLQQLAVGQALLDSEIVIEDVPVPKEKKEKRKAEK